MASKSGDILSSHFSMKRRDWDEWWRAFSAISVEPEGVWPVVDKSKFAGKSVLDSGCGVLEGYVGEKMSTSFFMGVDFSTYGIRFARWKNRAENLAVCDVSKLPFNNGSFDVVVSEAVLHHLAFNFEAGVREIARVSRESLFISTLHYDHYDFLDMESVDTKYGKVFRSHYVGTDEYRMDELLRDCGFEISSAKIHTVIEKGSRVKDGIFVEAIRK